MVDNKVSLNQISLLLESMRRENFEYHEKNLDNDETCDEIYSKLYEHGSAKIIEGTYRYFLHLTFHDHDELRKQLDNLI
jgi:hypothetical protein